MTRLEFNPSAQPTVGVEIELALVDAKTMALCSKNAAILNRIPKKYADKIKPELMQCYVEINTDVCESLPMSRRISRPNFGCCPKRLRRKTRGSTGRARTRFPHGANKKSRPTTGTWVSSTCFRTRPDNW